MTEDAYLSSLKRRYDFAAWEHARRLDAELHVWRFAMAGGELPGLELARIDAAEPAPPSMAVPLQVAERRTRTRDAKPPPPASQPEPRLSKSFWRPVGAPQALINIDVYECASRPAAHELLLQVLGGFQTTQLVRRDDLGIGDVAFGMPTGTTLVFARGNLVHLARNASRDTQDVTGIARHLDQQLVDRPPQSGRAVRAPMDAASGRHRLAPSQAAESTEAPLYLKLFSCSGTFAEQDGEIVLHPSGDKGPYDVGLVAVYPGRRQRQRTLRVG